MTIDTTPAGAIEGKTYELLIDGQWRQSGSGETFTRLNPANGTPVATCPKATKEDVEAAILAARRAFDSGVWSEAPAAQRAEVLRRIADKLRQEASYLGRIIASEVGRPLLQAILEVEGTAATFDYYAGVALDIRGDAITNYVADAVGLVLKEPVGVVGIITPWNYPLLLVGAKVAPALAAGCTMVVRPSQSTPANTYELGRIATEAGAPSGVVNVITGDSGTSGEMMLTSPLIDKIAFTGSTETGRRVMQQASGTFKRLMLELGGKSPNIVFADADVDAAVAGAIIGIYTNSGQICIAGTRLLVEREIHDEFMSKFLAFAGALKVGDPFDPETYMGPLISETQLRTVESYVEAGKQDGAALIKGGKRMSGDGLDRGFFFEPTVFDSVQNGMRIAQEEIFGPVLSVITFETVDEAIKIANETTYGLGAGIWSRDVNKIMKVAKAIKSGSVWVNCYFSGGIGTMPFGGYKQSGIGREDGREGLDAFMETKAIQIKLS